VTPRFAVAPVVHTPAKLGKQLWIWGIVISDSFVRSHYSPYLNIQSIRAECLKKAPAFLRLAKSWDLAPMNQAPRRLVHGGPSVARKELQL
jgi:hypothetical protein